jgi:hypothetical protein
MNGSQTIRTAGRIGGFCARHFLALVVTVAAPCVLWTLAYFALLIWAAASDGGIGSPIAYPLMLFFIVVGATAVALTVFLPSTALAEWFARRRGLPVLAQIPISVAVLAVFCFAISGVIVATGAHPLGYFFTDFVLLFLAHLVPLGLYWWVAQSGPILISLLQRLLSIFRS